MDTNDLITTLNNLSHELDLTIRSITDRCTNNASVTIGDLHLLHDLAPLESSLTRLSQSGTQLKSTMDGYCRWLGRRRAIILPDELDDKTVYSLYLYIKNEGTTLNLEPISEITYAAQALCQSGQFRKTIEFKDGTKLLDRQLIAPKNLPEEAISSDNVASFCLEMDISGKRLSPTLLRYLMQKRCVNILDHLIRINKKLPGVYPPENLLLTVLYEMDGCPLLPIIKAIEETFPGTIKSAEDASCRNALWYTLRHHSQVHHVNFCRALDIEDVEQYLLSKGCDPAKASNDHFSWQTMARLMRIIEHYETAGHIA